MIRIMAAALLAVGAIITASASANADPYTPPEQSYLQSLRGAGVPVSDERAVVKLGWNVCAGLHNGLMPGATVLVVARPEWTNQQDNAVVEAATFYLCPDMFPVVRAAGI